MKRKHQKETDGGGACCSRLHLMMADKGSGRCEDLKLPRVKVDFSFPPKVNHGL